MYKFYCYSIVLLLLSVAGCGKNVSISGKVTFSDDGSPVRHGVVCFQTESLLARGNIKQDGTYVLGTEYIGNGLPPGLYHVTVIDTRKLVGTTPQGDPIFENLVDSKASHRDTFNVTCDVTKSLRKFDITVDRSTTPRATVTP